jgi:hypothetical protein
LRLPGRVVTGSKSDSGDPAVAGVEDGVALWNLALAQQRNEKPNLPGRLPTGRILLLRTASFRPRIIYQLSKKLLPTFLVLDDSSSPPS